MGERGLRSAALTEAEREVLGRALWELLAWQAGQYTAGESSSLPRETVGELLEGLCFTLELERNPRALLGTALPEQLEEGRKRLRRQTDYGRWLYGAVCLTLPPESDGALTETLREIGQFWRRYDIRFFPHQIPCGIDYPLCRPVAEEKGGVAYINEYLARLLAENQVLAAFDPARCALLRRRSQWVEGLSNLCEPVLVNALGLSLAGEDPRPLAITAAQREKLREEFKGLAQPAATVRLQRGAEELCGYLGIRSRAARRYVSGVAVDLYPRLRAALWGGLEGMFVSLG